MFMHKVYYMYYRKSKYDCSELHLSRDRPNYIQSERKHKIIRILHFFKVFWRIRFCDSLILLSVDGAVFLEKKSQTNYQ